MKFVVVDEADFYVDEEPYRMDSEIMLIVETLVRSIYLPSAVKF